MYYCFFRHILKDHRGRIVVGMVFNATFNTILVISVRSVLLVEETGVSVQKTTDLPYVTDTVYHTSP
jgi:hypothetical protein